jgi:trigger factor
MQVSVETTNGLERKMTVQVPAERIEDEVNSRLRDLARRVRLHGFRPGKVPFKVVKQQYHNQVRGEVLSEVMQQSFQEAVIQEKLHPAGGPTIEPVNTQPGEALEYSATFEVYPEIVLAAFDDVSIQRPVAEVTDADVEAMIEKLRKQRTTWDPVERAAADGDQVTISFEGTIDGEPFSGGKAENVPLVLGSASMIPGFEDQLAGAKAGESRTVDVTFPEEYPREEVAGKEARFQVDVVTVSEAKLPEADDEFARTFGIAEGGMDALRKEVRANMERELNDKIRAKLKQQVMDAILEKNELDVPAALVDQEIDRAMEQAKEQQPETMRNMQLPRELFEESAQRRVKLGLLLGEILRANDIKVDTDRVRTTLESLAGTYDNPQEVIDAYRKNRSLMQELEGHVLEEQIVDFVLEQAQVVDQPASFEELANVEDTRA